MLYVCTKTIKLNDVGPVVFTKGKVYDWRNRKEEYRGMGIKVTKDDRNENHGSDTEWIKQNFERLCKYGARSWR
jgi:hypothetical protein